MDATEMNAKTREVPPAARPARNRIKAGERGSLLGRRPTRLRKRVPA
jgi:hypothetical protein